MTTPKKREYRAGNRGTGWQAGKGGVFDGKMSRSRVAWCSFYGGKVVLHAPEDTEDSELGVSYQLFFPNKRGAATRIDLTGMTEEELLCFKQLLDLALERALPVCQLRDKVAQDALANGDDSYSRVYRSAAQFFIRSGTVGSDPSRLHQRSEDLPAGDGDELDSSVDDRGDGDDVAAEGSDGPST